MRRLRHSSITYFLQLSNGDVKSVQKNSGHTNTKIVLDTYAQSQKRANHELIDAVAEDFYGPIANVKSLEKYSADTNRALSYSAYKANVGTMTEGIAAMKILSELQQKDPHLYKRVLSAMTSA